MKVVILCGGRGIRAFPFSEYMPKPMMPVGGMPIIVQIMKVFIAQGFDEFVLAAGHRKSVLDDYFDGKSIGKRVEVIDTGDKADTGDRILACRDLLGERFLATYGDGLADIPVADLVEYHDSHSGLATVTCVPLYSQYGVLDFDENGRVDRMREKPRMQEHWMNAGFFVFDREVFDHWNGNDLENHVLPYLVERGLLYGYRHDGFFKSLDSYKDQQEFEEIIEKGGRLPWVPDGARRHST